MSETPWMFHQGVILFQTTFRTVGRPPSQPQPHQANAGGAYGAILDILCGRLLSACLFRASLCRVGNTSLFLPRPAGHYSRHSDTTKTSRGVPRSVPRLTGSPWAALPYLFHCVQSNPRRGPTGRFPRPFGL